MRILACDICDSKEKKIIRAKWKISVRNAMGAKLSLDVCEEHKDFFKGLNYEQGLNKWTDIFMSKGKDLKVL